MEAKQRKLAQYHGSSTKELVNNITPAEGAVRPVGNVSPVRASNTYKSTLSLGGPQLGNVVGKKGKQLSINNSESQRSLGQSARDLYFANVQKNRSPERDQAVRPQTEMSQEPVNKTSKKRLASNTFKSTINVYEPEINTGDEAAGVMAAPEVRQPPKTARARAQSHYDGKKLILEGSSTRNEANWESSVFSGSQIVKGKKKLLNKPDHGKETFYGNEGSTMHRRNDFNKAGFEKNSKSMTKFEMIPKDYDATKRSQKEFYGDRAEGCMSSRFRQQDLIAANADWSNPQHAPQFTNKNYMDPIPERRTRKQRVNDSSAANFLMQGMTNHDDFKAGEIETGDKIASSATWFSTAATKPSANRGNINPYKLKQNELGSNSKVFEQTDYSSHQPLSKRNYEPEESSNKKIDIGDPNYLRNGKTQSTLSQYAQPGPSRNYNSVGQKNKFLSSTLDRHQFVPTSDQKAKVFEPDHGIKSGPMRREPTEYQTSSQSGLATAGPFFEAHNVSNSKKLEFLQSNIMNGASTQRYTKKGPLSEMTSQMIDLDLQNLPPHIDKIAIKRITGAKHVIDTEFKHDAMKGTCTGQGRIRLRLQDSEDLNKIRSNLAIAGIRTAAHHEDPQKKPLLTGNESNPANPLNIKKSKDFEGVTVQKRSAQKPKLNTASKADTGKSRWK